VFSGCRSAVRDQSSVEAMALTGTRTVLDVLVGEQQLFTTRPSW
jgi:hypothetical protein